MPPTGVGRSCVRCRGSGRSQRRDRRQQVGIRRQQALRPATRMPSETTPRNPGASTAGNDLASWEWKASYSRRAVRRLSGDIAVLLQAGPWSAIARPRVAVDGAAAIQPCRFRFPPGATRRAPRWPCPARPPLVAGIRMPVIEGNPDLQPGERRAGRDLAVRAKRAGRPVARISRNAAALTFGVYSSTVTPSLLRSLVGWQRDIRPHRSRPGLAT
jgi:hypothetical protein